MRVHVRARHERMVEIVREHGSLGIAEVAAALGISMVTVRRDAALLVSEGRLGRVHGSLVWPGTGRAALPPVAAAAPAKEGTVIGMIVPTMDHSFSEIVQGARTVLARRGARLVLSLSGYLIEEDRSQVERFVASGVSGLLLTPSWEEGMPGSGAAEPVLAAPVPTVLVERWTGPGDPSHGLDRVRSDSAYGAGTAVHHLAGLGHRRIALALQPSPHGRQLRAGFEDALTALGLPGAPSPGFAPDRSASEAERYDLTLEFLRRGVREDGITAAFVHSDADAVVLVPRLQDLGIRVPQDLALVVYDDEVAGLSGLPLTAVAPPRRAVGAQAAGLLLDRLADGEDRPRRHIELLPRLRVRESCGGGAQHM
ncbi:substrate-binding domain-containing protein [Streptomyces sp. NPDC059989]|uniref:LacI family DNA-binding transcriptional regulator n=1 Tax=Streptomyces sp. NPDC059989 TaxID=3347026 RepID=UPI0036ACBEB0